MESNKATSAKNPKGNEITSNVLPITINERHSKDVVSKFEDKIDLSDFAGGIGKLLGSHEKPFTFVVGGVLIAVPALTKSNDQFFRSASAFKSVANSIFAGKEKDVVITDKNHVLILSSFVKKGIKFSTYCKASVLEGLKIWEQNKRLKISVIVEKTRKLNNGLRAENEEMKPLVKQLRAENLSELTGLRIEAKKSLEKFINQ